MRQARSDRWRRSSSGSAWSAASSPCLRRRLSMSPLDLFGRRARARQPRSAIPWRWRSAMSCTAGSAFAAMAAATMPRARTGRFFIVTLVSLGLNSLFVVILTGHAAGPIVVAGHPDPVRDPARHLLAEPAMGVRLMERRSTTIWRRSTRCTGGTWRAATSSTLIRRRIKPPEGARILEIGCGTGHNLDMLRPVRRGRRDRGRCGGARHGERSGSASRS